MYKVLRVAKQILNLMLNMRNLLVMPFGVEKKRCTKLHLLTVDMTFQNNLQLKMAFLRKNAEENTPVLTLVMRNHCIIS